jgi:hypothetical protein
MKYKRKMWGSFVILLGLWEAFAFMGKAPTITRSWQKLAEQHSKAALAVLLLFEAGLFKHMRKIYD